MNFYENIPRVYLKQTCQQQGTSIIVIKTVDIGTMLHQFFNKLSRNFARLKIRLFHALLSLFEVGFIGFSNVDDILVADVVTSMLCRMLETDDVGDKLKILVTDSLYRKKHQHNDSNTDILKLSPS